MRVKLLRGAKLPAKGRPDDAGYDLFFPEDAVIGPGMTVVAMGVCVELPKGYAGLLALRSSAAKTGLILQNPLIDANYRGEIHAIFLNLTGKEIRYAAGERACSLYAFPVYSGALEEADELTETDRGASWNGSSGK